jgi:hypothetical protein
MSGPILGKLSNNRWSGGILFIYTIFYSLTFVSKTILKCNILLRILHVWFASKSDNYNIYILWFILFVYLCSFLCMERCDWKVFPSIILELNLMSCRTSTCRRPHELFRQIVARPMPFTRGKVARDDFTVMMGSLVPFTRTRSWLIKITNAKKTGNQKKKADGTWKHGRSLISNHRTHNDFQDGTNDPPSMTQRLITCVRSVRYSTSDMLDSGHALGQKKTRCSKKSFIRSHRTMRRRELPSRRVQGLVSLGGYNIK